MVRTENPQPLLEGFRGVSWFGGVDNLWKRNLAPRVAKYGRPCYYVCMEKGHDMKNATTRELPRYCSFLCADEAYAAGAHEGVWVDTESEEWLNAHPEAEECCDWC